ncbi:MAG: UDP-4-amino-4,6-dideoxy-N-acetyl-beta-L-altrosamine transaminase [Deltaproteobacteria bacterium]|nr:MAG: UDP-4-amino-4,6-dideoxy-N-acetyl-beta-L-altrosamine transaminase [Deltaproteobacteria bacterium]
MGAYHSLQSVQIAGPNREGEPKIRYIPYARQWIDEDDIKAVIAVLRSDWLTTGPMVEKFEQAFADYVGTKYAVAVSSGTAALHAAMFAIGIGPEDEVIVPSMTFVATANGVVFRGGSPIFADVDPDTLLIDPQQVEEKITSRTRAIIAVDYAGQPCDYDVLRSITKKHDLVLIADACHALGAQYKNKNVGMLADLTVFSFHPVKHITTGEGGMITTDDPDLAERMRRFRNHGIDADHARRAEQGTWRYEMTALGYNYRITDFQSALGLSQVAKLPSFLHRRWEIAGMYDQAFASAKGINPLYTSPDVVNSYHLYVIRVKERDRLFAQLRRKGIGVNVHYFPVHLQPYYRKTFGTSEGLCPNTEKVYKQILSLPIFPQMNDNDIERVVTAVEEVLN